MPRPAQPVLRDRNRPHVLLLGRLSRALLTAAVIVAVMLLSGFPPPPPRALAQEATPAISETTATSPVPAASSWLRAQQEASGGFLGYTGETDPATTTDAVMALAAAQESDPEATAALAAAVAYLEENGAAYAQIGPGQAAKLAMAAIAGGRAPRDFAGMDLVAAMTAPLATPVPGVIEGIYGDDLYDHALVIIGLAAAGEEIPDAALEPLRVSQQEGGGWSFDGSTEGGADSNTSALVVQALAAAGRAPDPMVDRALAFLSTLLAPDHTGFAFDASAEPLVADANSTALVVQALLAVGEDPTSQEWGNAALALARFQTASGGLRYLASDADANLLATVQGIPAMAGLPLPVVTGCADEAMAASGECVVLAPAA